MMAITAGDVLGHLFVPGTMPGMNEIIDARLTINYNKPKPTNGRRQWNQYTFMKRRWTMDLKTIILTQGFPVIEEGYFTYVFDERDRRRDPSNFIAGGVKLIEDGLQFAGHLPNDGWTNVLGIRSFWRPKPERPGVHLIVTADDCLTFEEAVFEADKPIQKAKPKPSKRETIDLSPLDIE